MNSGAHTILLVEDDSNDAILFKRTLSPLKTVRAVEAVSTGELALAYLDGRDSFADRALHPLPALIFLDLKLPGVSGFEVLSWIRQQGRLDKIHVVVLTGSRKSLDVYRAYELGANSYLAKPVRPLDIAGLADILKTPWLTLPVPLDHPQDRPSVSL